MFDTQEVTLRTKSFTQYLYVGEVKATVNLPKLDLVDVELGKACMAYAESHIAEPQAQFRDYILKDPTTLVTMQTGNTASFLAGTLFEPQITKHMCQGVGGHLGEGATALAVETMLGLPGRIAHTAIRKGKQRAPDFVVIASLEELLKGPYKQKLQSWEKPGKNDFLPIPVEAKARRDSVSKMRRFLKEGALQQVISYWWAMSRPGGCQPVVGYGLVTAFCHQTEEMIHCLLRPRSQKAWNELVDMLELGCPRKEDLPGVIDTDQGLEDVLALLEGF